MARLRSPIPPAEAARPAAGPRRAVLRAALFLLLLVAARGAAAQGLATAGGPSAPAVAVRASGPIELDGRPDEAAWAAARPLPLVQQTPTYGGALPVETDFRFLYDDEFVYVGVRCLDDRPPIETTFRRDNWSDNDDQVAFGLDTFNDRETMVVFVLYSTGARIDAMMANDARQMEDANVDWNTFWDGRTDRDADGWSAELRIPISSLRFEPGPGGEVVMGVNAYRYLARTQSLMVYPDVPPDWGFWSFMKPSKGERHAFSGLRSSRPIYFTPYATAGLGQAWNENAAGTGYEREDEITRDLGFDVKVGLTSNLTFDATVNTDFAQVEADDQQVNLTRFSLFFPEKRQFFLERTSNFTFSFGENDGLFYSRRIGISGGGEVPILGGARLVGRIGGLDVGLLTMQSARHRHRPCEDGAACDPRIPSTHFGVLRLKKQVWNANSYVGAAVTSRREENLGSGWNTSVGADALVNVAGDDYLQFAWAQTYADGLANAALGAANHRLRVQLVRAREIGFRYEAGFNRAGRDYEPGIGFQSREDYTQARGVLGWSARPGEPSPVANHGGSIESNLYWRNADRSLETAGIEAGYMVGLRRNWVFTATGLFTREDLLEGFDLSDDSGVPAGRYDYAALRGEINLPSSWPVSTTATVNVGSFFDGRRVGMMLTPRWSPSPHLRITGGWGAERIEFPDRGQTFESILLRTTTELTVSTRITLSALVKYNSAADALSANVRFRFNPREGNDFYLVYNEGFHTDRYGSVPTLPVSSTRTVLLKYAYTFLR